MPAWILYFQRIVSKHFFAGLYAVAKRLSVSQPDTSAEFVESKLSIDQVTMVLDKPLNANLVAVPKFLVSLERHDARVTGGSHCVDFN